MATGPQAISLRSRRATSPARGDWNQSAIAIVAALATVLLVIIVMLLMAFIEYQSRLMRHQPGIRTSEIMDAVSRELGVEDEFVTQRDTGRSLQKATDELRQAQSEVRFRIERMCSLFGTDETDSRIQRCRSFLARLPFDGTLDTPEGSTPKPAQQSANDASPVEPANGDPEPSRRTRSTQSDQGSWEAFNDAVLSSFVREMEDDEEGRDRIARYLPVFSDDLVKIAHLNQEIYTTLSFRVEKDREIYTASCFRSAILIAEIKYQDPLLQCGPSAPSNNAPDAPGRSALPAPPPNGTTPVVGTGAPGAVPAGSQIGVDPNLMDKQRRFDLVRQFRIYNTLSLGLARPLLLSPPDYLATWLLFFGGALGSMLKILFWHIMPVRENRWSYLLVEPAQGLVCAIILFILFRSGVVVVAGAGTQGQDSSPLSPYFVAFMAIGAGLMSDQVLHAFRNAAKALIGDGALRQPNRWAVGLPKALEEYNKSGGKLTADQLATRVGVATTRMQNWLSLQAAVEPEHQDQLSLVLGVPGYELFTDIDPKTAPPAAAKPAETAPAAEPSQEAHREPEEQPSTATEAPIVDAQSPPVSPPTTEAGSAPPSEGKN